MEALLLPNKNHFQEAEVVAAGDGIILQKAAVVIMVGEAADVVVNIAVIAVTVVTVVIVGGVVTMTEAASTTVDEVIVEGAASTTVGIMTVVDVEVQTVVGEAVVAMVVGTLEVLAGHLNGTAQILLPLPQWLPQSLRRDGRQPQL
jgi:hypothetical protein